jgi:hypothetical protein
MVTDSISALLWCCQTVAFPVVISVKRDVHNDSSYMQYMRVKNQCKIKIEL